MLAAKEFERLTVTTATAATRRGDISALELVEASLARIQDFDDELHSFIELRAEAALAEARRLDSAKGERGLLHGAPVAVKDNLLVAGMHARAGSKLLEGVRRNTTATAVQRLRRAGAIVVGHSSMYELAFGAQSREWGEPLNPHDHALATAGSSSGSAAAVAAGFVLAAVATDTGGSIRVPASFCRVVGLRPPAATVPRRGLIRLSRLDEIGPIARTVADVARLYRLLGNSAGRPYQAAPNELRVAVPEFIDTDQDVMAAVESFCVQLGDLGIRVVRRPALPLEDAARALWTIASADAAELWLRRVSSEPELVHPLVRRRIEEGGDVDAVTLETALCLRASTGRAIFSEFETADLLAMPAAACSSYPRGARTVVTPRGQEDVSSAVTRYTPLASVTGAAALVLPCATQQHVGVQLLAPTNRTDALLALGERYESAW